jgi:hypothetical protein
MSLTFLRGRARPAVFQVCVHPFTQILSPRRHHWIHALPAVAAVNYDLAPQKQFPTQVSSSASTQLHAHALIVPIVSRDRRSAAASVLARVGMASSECLFVWVDRRKVRYAASCLNCCAACFRIFKSCVRLQGLDEW